MSTTSDMDDKSEKSHESYLATIVTAFLMGNINDSDSLNGPVLNENIKSVYWVFIIQYAILAILGIVTNIAIISYVMYHKLFKDITHAFIVNLSLCHVVQCAIVLPITLMVMLIQNWIWGQFLCFFLPMLQDIPLHVAMISHILIAWDRMRWLGDPLKGRLPTFVCCCASWLTGMVIALPYPIYTLYLDLGDYVPHLKGMGLCIVNLLDDMHEYMRGLFVIMYCGPVILLAYLYIRTSAELRPPDGPFAVMMFEHRAELRNRQRNSTTSTGHHQLATRQNSNHSYDLYSAELDLSMEKRTQRNLGSMAVTQVLCICPLMILRLAKMVMIETYENSKHFDFTYLMFVWIAFLPTVIFPCIYATQILPRTEKERLRGYFRLSSRRSKKSRQTSQEDSIEQENTTSTELPGGSSGCGGGGALKSSNKDTLNNNLRTRILNPLSRKYDDVIIGPPRPIIPKTTTITSATNTHSTTTITTATATLTTTLTGTQSSVGFLQPRKSFANSNSVNTSCSNITSSTYCNNGSMNGGGVAGGGSSCALAGVGGIGCGVNCGGGGGGSSTNNILNTSDNNQVKGTIEKNDSIDYETVSILSDSTAKDSYFEKKWLNTSIAKDNMSSFSDFEGTSTCSFTRNDSSSTFERDLEIIDLLERERSMDIQDMMQREIRGEIVRNYSMERRRLPDLEKICKSPKVLESSTPYLSGFNNSFDNNYSTAGYKPTAQHKLLPHSKRLNYKNSFHSTSGEIVNRLPKRDSLKSIKTPTTAATIPLSVNNANMSETPIIVGGFSENDVVAIGGVGLIAGTTSISTNINNDDSRFTRNSSNSTSFNRSTSKSGNRDYPIPTTSHPVLDFRENIFAQL